MRPEDFRTADKLIQKSWGVRMWTRAASRIPEIPRLLSSRISRVSAPFRPRPATMSTSLPHEVRTVSEPRQRGLHSVFLSHITQLNPTIRLLRLSLSPNSSAPPSNAEVSLPYNPLMPSPHPFTTPLSPPPNSTVSLPIRPLLPWPMARRPCPLDPPSRRIHHHLNPI